MDMSILTRQYSHENSKSVSKGQRGGVSSQVVSLIRILTPPPGVLVPPTLVYLSMYVYIRWYSRHNHHPSCEVVRIAHIMRTMLWVGGTHSRGGYRCRATTSPPLGVSSPPPPHPGVPILAGGVPLPHSSVVKVTARHRLEYTLHTP